MSLRPLAPLVALVVLLAGCAERADEPVDAVSDASGAEGAAPAVDDGTVPMDFDAGTQPHLHDYWMGRERVTLFEGTLTPDPAGDDFLEATAVAALIGREARVGGVAFLLPDGQIVYEGTGAMEITATPADPTTTGVALSYKSADTTEWTAPVALAGGQPLTIEVSPAMADMPHSPTSRWAFLFQPEAPGAMLGAFSLRVDVVKTRDVTLYPGHPDLFEGKDEKVLMEGHHRTEKFAYATRGAYLLQNGDFGEPEFAPQEVVPMDTTLIRVEVRITGTEATAGEVTEARFFYRGADRSQLQSGGKAVEGSWEEKRLVWEVPVTMEMVDSPYAKDSQWRFMVEPATQFAGPDPTCGGCVDSALEFDVLITAYRVAPQAEGAEADEDAAGASGMSPA